MSEVQIYTIDRFEDNDLVVLETEEGRSVIFSREFLPLGCKEGDVLAIEKVLTEQGSSLSISLNLHAAEAKKDRLKDLRARLAQAPEGDIVI